MCKRREALEEALTARNAATNALLNAVLSAAKIEITAGLNIIFEPHDAPLHAVYDGTLHNGIPDDMLENLKKVN